MIQRVGLWLAAVFVLTDLGRVHDVIPGLAALKPGFLTQLALFLAVLTQLPRLRTSPVLWWRGAFLLSVAPGLVLGYGVGNVIRIFRGEAERFLSGFLGILIFVRTLKDVRFLHNVFLFLSVFASLWVLTHGGHGPGGVFRDENDAAMLLVMLLPFAYFRMQAEAASGRKMFFLVLFFLNLAAIGATHSRGGMVGTLPILAFIWWKSPRKIPALFLVTAVLAGAVWLAPEGLVNEFLSIRDTEGGTAGQRRYYWGLSLELFRLHPFFGVGAGCWGNALWTHIAEGDLDRPDRRLPNMTPHSIYFEVLSELGLVGTLCWLGLLVAVGASLWALRREKLRSASAAVAPEDPLEFAVWDRQRAYMENLVPAQAISLAGFLACGAFLSAAFYPCLSCLAAFIQATRQSWENEVALQGILAPAPSAVPEPEPEAA